MIVPVAAVLDPVSLRTDPRHATVRPPGGAGDDEAGALPPDRVSISSEASQPEGAGPRSPLKANGLDQSERQEVQRLQRSDSEVHAHEAAHQAAAGALGGGASFTYQAGPDGRQYAVGGEVPIRVAPGRTPEETIENARQVRAAALAPADPSAQDLAVATSAAQMEAAARTQQARQAADAYRRVTGTSGAAARQHPAGCSCGAEPLATGQRQEEPGALV
jgi:hypothetical protein